MKIVAFDLGAHTACAHNLFGEGKERVSHVDAKGERPQRFAELWQWLVNVAEGVKGAGGCDAWIFERPFARGAGATRSLWGVAALIEATAAEYGWPVLDVTPNEIKKHATGRGNAEKDDMLLAASCTGYAGENEHEADAWCLMRYAEDNLKPVRTKKRKGK